MLWNPIAETRRTALVPDSAWAIVVTGGTDDETIVLGVAPTHADAMRVVQLQFSSCTGQEKS
jgi:hypothetical protein